MAEKLRAENRFAVELCDDPEAWDAFVERNDGPVYALWGCGDAVESYGHTRWYLVARDREEDAIMGVLPLFHIESRLFGSKLLSPAFAERGSVVVGDVRPEATKNFLLERTKALARKLDVDFVSLRGSQVSGTDGYVEKNRYVTFRVSTDRTPDEVWSDVKDSRQRQIEQADDDASLEFGVGDSLEDLRKYYRLYLESMRGHGSPAHSFEFFRILWDRLHDAGNLRLSTIHRDGELINGMIDLSLGSTVYQWGVITDYEHRDRNGGSLLLWKSLEWAAENGYDTYEFGRTREGSGVYMFKKSFGGAKTWYDDLHYFPRGSAELPDPEDDKYDLAKAVWRRLPIPVTRVIGPRIRKRIGL